MHGEYPELESGDLLLLCGDYTASGRMPQWVNFFCWLKRQKYRKKVVIGGNHDNYLASAFPKTQKEADECKEVVEFLEFIPDFEYLCDSGCEFEGLKIWGSPWTKNFFGQNPECKHFGLDTEDEMYEKFVQIPEDTDILMSHSPPQGHLDKSYKNPSRLGSVNLKRVVARVQPKIHFFGHIHGGYGKETRDDIIYYNCAHMNDVYDPTNNPHTIIHHLDNI